ncbi:MAG: hypothetical protein HYY92_01595, partial [Parcubacteria group bacterium]|nr:hypothetical protein [Parcubacteria group bacterium]
MKKQRRWFAAKDAAFRTGFSFAAGLSEPTMAALWRMTAIMLLFPVLWVSGSVFFHKEVDEEAVRFFMRHHIGRVYFVYP